MTMHSQRKANSAIWKKLRIRILERDDWTCAWCYKYADTVDHIVPVSKNGTDDPENLVASCRKCNYSRGNKSVTEFFLQGDSTVMSPRGFNSPPNDSESHA